MVAGELADDLLATAPALTAASGLLLRGGLVSRVEVRSRGVGRRIVRLRHGTAVAGAEDPDPDVVVRRLLLDRRCDSRRTLMVAGELADELLATAPALAAVSGLLLRGGLVSRVEVRAVALDEAVFERHRPPSPGPRTRIPTLVFEGFSGPSPPGLRPSGRCRLPGR